ncbi:Mu-like prophage major head subunit gpT family protein [Neptunomonas antarctica]|uniref:Mu-like prophage major head subunit gpT n=1 Tax=Neptunomonas antarctica TaxID=619304 RepID=A0A1N7MPG5_9GAMM|nr:Mu-like prophage major head subunit gpT family protein [Neptunomonas antarctica]SIS87940.1 Mu-like prophage major head subunit gpT [Neptunomonas antarctica]
MEINANNLGILNTAVKTAFNNAFAGAPSQYQRVATVIPSTGAANTYAWLGNSSQIREWLGERAINRLKDHDFTIKNRKFEKTEAIPRDVIEDDQFGVYTPLFAQMGQDAAEFPDVMTFALLKDGFTTPCYDGQNFFDTDHPVGNGEAVVSVSNMQAGAGEGWYLLSTKRAIKPLIWQTRRPFNLVMKKDANTSDHVFMTDEYIWGTDARCNAGFGLWQLAFASKADLSAANFNAARTAMIKQKNDAGSPLGVIPDLMVVGPDNMSKAELLLEAVNNANGASNTNYKKVELLVCPWLA